MEVNLDLDWDLEAVFGSGALPFAGEVTPSDGSGLPSSPSVRMKSAAAPFGAEPLTSSFADPYAGCSRLDPALGC